MIVICDVQFFRNNDKSIILKSFSCCELFNSNDIIDHFVFKPPFPFSDLNLTRRAEARHVTHFYHHINWDEGFIPYNDMSALLRSYLSNATEVIVKGDEKVKFINSVLHKNLCYDVEKLNCPKLKDLKAGYSFFSSPPVSSLNVKVLRTWLNNLFKNSMERVDSSIKSFNSSELSLMKSHDIYFLPAHFLIDKMERDNLKNCLKFLPPHLANDISIKKYVYSDDGWDEPDLNWGSA